jgi:hypothetical protein
MANKILSKHITIVKVFIFSFAKPMPIQQKGAFCKIAPDFGK